jgi:hypothetical protein
MSAIVGDRGDQSRSLSRNGLLGNGKKLVVEWGGSDEVLEK